MQIQPLSQGGHNPSAAAEHPPGLTHGPTRRWRVSLTSLGSVLVVFIAWILVAKAGVFPHSVFPSPERVIRDLVRTQIHGFSGHSLLFQTGISTARILVGFVAAVMLGVLLGVWMAVSPRMQEVVNPWLQFLRPVPPLAFIPLLVLWFGIGELPKVLLIFFCTLPIIILNTRAGVQNVPISRIRVAQCLGATRAQIWRHVILPSALAEIFTGMRIGMGIAWTCLVAAEMVAASRGLGFLVIQAGRNLQVGMVFVGIVMIGVVGFLMDAILGLAEHHWVPWKGQVG